jgi:hypothetical protein
MAIIAAAASDMVVPDVRMVDLSWFDVIFRCNVCADLATQGAGYRAKEAHPDLRPKVGFGFLHPQSSRFQSAARAADHFLVETPRCR